MPLNKETNQTGVMVPLGVLLVGRMDQNMNLKEKWVMKKKWVQIKNGYKSYVIHICNQYVNHIWFGIE